MSVVVITARPSETERVRVAVEPSGNDRRTAWASPALSTRSAAVSVGAELVRAGSAHVTDPADRLLRVATHYAPPDPRGDRAHGLRAAGHWGVPTMVFEGEPFFGQDRFDHLVWRMAQKGLTWTDGLPAGCASPANM